MRRALSLFALGSTLLMASADQTVSIITALNSPSLNKDSWSFTGIIRNSPSVADLFEYGIEMRVYTNTPDGLDSLIFDADECKPIRKGTGARCSTKGARFIMTEATDGTYYDISGSAKRREFEREETVNTSLGLILVVNKSGEATGIENCTRNEGSKGQLRVTCPRSSA